MERRLEAKEIIITIPESPSFPPSLLPPFSFRPFIIKS